MKRIILCLGIFTSLTTHFAEGKKISFAYDDAGNRVQRTIVASSPSKARGNESAGTPYYRDSLGDKDIKLHYGNDGNVLVEFIGHDWEKRSIGLYTIDGVVVETFMTEEATATIHCADHPGGIYIITISDGTDETSWKIIKR